MIEVIALWEGRLTTNHLCAAFGIGRQQASKDINTYNKVIAPGNLEYDKHLKGYRPAVNFKPIVTTGDAGDYLHTLSFNQDLAVTFQGLDFKATATQVLHAPARNVRPEVVRPLLTAARNQQRLECDYVSINAPNREGRIIVPHTLVFNGVRWHVRAYCEKNGDFRDFVLSRFRGEPELLGSSDKSAADDEAWQTEVKIRIKPDPRLSREQKQVIAEEYGMKRSQLVISTRGPLVQYTLQQLQIDPKMLDGRATAQQLIVANLEEIREWFFF